MEDKETRKKLTELLTGKRITASDIGSGIIGDDNFVLEWHEIYAKIGELVYKAENPF